MNSPSEIARRRHDHFARLPFAQAGAGCETAQRELAMAYLAAADFGLPAPLAAHTGVAFARLAASHGGTESVYILACALLAQAKCHSPEDTDTLKETMGEAIACLHRAGLGGHKQANHLLTNLPLTGDMDVSEIFAIGEALVSIL